MPVEEVAFSYEGGTGFNEVPSYEKGIYFGRLMAIRQAFVKAKKNYL